MNVVEPNSIGQPKLQHIPIEQFAITTESRIDFADPQCQALKREIAPNIIKHHPSAVFFQPVSKTGATLLVHVITTSEITVLNRTAHFIDADIAGQVDPTLSGDIRESFISQAGEFGKAGE